MVKSIGAAAKLPEKPAKRTKGFSFNVTESDYEKIRAYCEANEWSASEYARWLCLAFIDGEVIRRETG